MCVDLSDNGLFEYGPVIEGGLTESQEGGNGATGIGNSGKVQLSRETKVRSREKALQNGG